MFNLIILPNQLISVPLFPNKSVLIYLVEHPYYFTRFKFHKLKLAFLVASMKNYKDYLEKNNIKVKYIHFYDYTNFIKSLKVRDVNKQYMIFDPIDLEVTTEFVQYGFEILDSPLFLLSSTDLKDINYKRLFAFYNNAKKIVLSKFKLDYLNLKNLDKLNRKTMSASVLQEFRDMVPKYNNKHYAYSIKYVEKHFKDNFGILNAQNLGELPVTFADAKKHLMCFIKQRFATFGPYQDFISKDHTRLYHSHISYLINIGLLTPLQVLKEIEKIRPYISEQSFEAFVRQIVGWREYMRYLYLRTPDLRTHNFWKSRKSLDWDKFYGNKSTGITFIDNEIEKLKYNGWAHHIIRIMVFLNYFILTGIKPADINRWFHETIALDSYDWVMVSNIWTMGYFSKEYTSKPYFISSNYIRKMSNYKNINDFEKIDDLYHKFIEDKKDFKFYRF